MTAQVLPPPPVTEKGRQLTALLQDLSPLELQWWSGYAAGLAVRGAGSTAVVAPPVVTPEPSARVLTIIYGTATGNSRKLAERFKEQTEAAGTRARVVRASDYPLKELAHERLLVVVISTQGDGDPPDDARAFYEFVVGKRAPRLEGLQFSVLGLGDSSYPRFCHVARVLDERLRELGAKPLAPRVDCDVEFEAAARGWMDKTAQALKVDAPALAVVTPIRSAPLAQQQYTQEKPCTARVLANQRITAFEAPKDVRHVELGVTGANLAFEPGDSLGVIPRNAEWLVDQVLSATRLDGGAVVARDGVRWPLRQWLSEGLELTRLDRPFLAAHADRNSDGALKPLLAGEQKDALQQLLASHQVVDVLRRFPATWSAVDLVTTLRRLKPRLYSIASSRAAHADEVHLTVAVVDYQAFGSRHVGAASGHLASLRDDQTVDVFVERNERFRLPRDGSRNIIMVGPGTGVAPFRAFVQHRAEAGDQGKNWLLFGEQHFRTTFLYQVEWLEALKKGTLHQLDVAFSRDQAHKVYVQDRIREQGAKLFAWLQEGATLYVCGDAKRMAPDVEKALLDVAAQHGGLKDEDARNWLHGLSQEQRYLRDVY